MNNEHHCPLRLWCNKARTRTFSGWRICHKVGLSNHGLLWKLCSCQDVDTHDSQDDLMTMTSKWCVRVSQSRVSLNTNIQTGCDCVAVQIIALIYFHGTWPGRLICWRTLQGRSWKRQTRTRTINHGSGYMMNASMLVSAQSAEFCQLFVWAKASC